ncbi:MAG: TolC family protein [Bacteroidetes bacterium]|nr:TolC family protein [Bacteroidota bacterium]
MINANKNFLKQLTKYGFFALMLGAFSASAQENTQPAAMTLQQCIDYALVHQPSVLNAQLDEKIAKQKVNEIRGIGLPQLSGGLDVKDFVEIPTSLIPGDFVGRPAGTFLPVKFGTKYNATADITGSQLLFDGGYIIGLKAAGEYTKLARKMTTKSKIDLTENITKAYYGVIVNKERAKLLDINLVRLKKIFDDTKAYNVQGFVEKIDVDRLEVAYNNLNTEKEKVTKLLEISKYLLKFQMGMPLENQFTLTDELDIKKIVKDGTDEIDYNKRIEFSMTQSAKELYKLDAMRYKMSYLPSLVAYGTAQRSAQRNEFNFLDTKEKWYPTAIIGAKLSVPIFDGLQKHAKIQQAELVLKKTENDEINLKNLIDFQTKVANITFENSLKSLEIQKKNMELAQNVVNAAQIKNKAGVGSNLEITTAEAGLREAQVNYFDALYNAIIAKIDLQKAKGTLVP